MRVSCLRLGLLVFLPLLMNGCRVPPSEKTAHAVSAADFLYPQTDAFRQRVARAQARGLLLTDTHIHLRNGMTAEQAAERQERSGIRSAVLENAGREWPLSNTVALASFIDAAARVRADGQRLPVGIQVNDRDWYTQIDPALLKQLDFVLADTMIMGVNAEGRPQRLWLPDLTLDDPGTWMKAYFAHNLRILDEPISILANPTYLPPCISNRYDQLWTEPRMRQLIAQAIKNHVALEIQAESPYPHLSFLKLAKAMGARFSFGSNNHFAQTKDLSSWFDAIEALDLKPADLWSPESAPARFKP